MQGLQTSYEFTDEIEVIVDLVEPELADLPFFKELPGLVLLLFYALYNLSGRFQKLFHDCSHLDRAFFRILITNSDDQRSEAANNVIFGLDSLPIFHRLGKNRLHQDVSKRMQKLTGVFAHLSEALGRRELGIFIFEAFCNELHELLSFLDRILPFLIWLFQDVRDVFDDFGGYQTECEVLGMRQLE